MNLIIIAAIVVGIVVVLLVVNARLRRDGEPEDFARRPDGADDVWFTGGPGAGGGG